MEDLVRSQHSVPQPLLALPILVPTTRQNHRAHPTPTKALHSCELDTAVGSQGNPPTANKTMDDDLHNALQDQGFLALGQVSGHSWLFPLLWGLVILSFG